MPLKKLALFLVTSGAAAKAWAWWRRRRQAEAEQRQQRDLTQQVARWEDEGGTAATPVSTGTPQAGDPTPAAAASTRRRVRKPIEPDRTVPGAG